MWKNTLTATCCQRRWNLSSEGIQGTGTDPLLFNISVTNLDARPENALLKCVNDRRGEVLLSPQRSGSQIQTNSE